MLFNRALYLLSVVKISIMINIEVFDNELAVFKSNISAIIVSIRRIKLTAVLTLKMSRSQEQ